MPLGDDGLIEGKIESHGDDYDHGRDNDNMIFWQ